MGRGEQSPQLSPGIGFQLDADGSWKVSKIPHGALDSATFSGHLTINGYRCTVFDTNVGTWAQKSVNTPATASSDVDWSSVVMASRQSEATTLRIASRIVMGEPVRMLPPGTPSVAARVADAWLRQADRADDLVAQVSDVMEDGRADTEYDEAIADYCDQATATVAQLQEDCRDMVDSFISEAHKMAESGHEKVQKVFADRVRDSLIRAALEIKTVGSRTLGALAKELAECKAEAERS